MRALAALALALLVAGCGFHLRGTADVPFRTVHVPGTGGIALDLRRNIAAGTRAALVEDPKQAEAVLAILAEQREKVILSLTAGGRVNEYQLRYRVGFRVHDGRGGGDFVPATSLVLTRDITFNDAQVLAKEAEEQLLYRDMQADMVQQIMRRLAAAQRPRADQ